MSGYQVSTGGWSGFFAVPSDVVDRHLKLAPPDAIRALLYILRHGTVRPDAQEISRALGIEVCAAVDALDYWVSDGLLAPETQKETAPVAREAAALPADEPDTVSLPEIGEPAAEAGPAVVIRSGKMPGYSHAQIRDAFTEHPELRELFASAEEVFAHPLSDAVVNLLYGLFDWYGLPVAVIVTVLRRCQAGDRLRPAAIRDEADRFYKHGAITEEAADVYAAELDERDAAVDEIVRLLRITDHAPYARERKAFETWRFSYEYTPDVIAAALDVALRNTESDAYSPDLLPYMQKVLTNWHKGGVRTAEEAKEAAAHKDKPEKGSSRRGQNQPSGGRSYDLDDEAKRAMQRFAGKDAGD